MALSLADPPVRRDTLPHEVDVAVIGAGFSGLAAAIRLQQAGLDDFVILERHDDVGGTWWANTYPGCQCDVPSHLYSLSFAPNPDWSETYSTQPEIQAYLRRVATEHGVLERVRLGCDVQDAEWDAAARRWRLRTSHAPLTARVVIAGFGPLTEPSRPDIPGLERFEGAVFHSAEWDHDHDLTGERVAVVGTGASAIQFVPEIQPRVAKLHLFQRTPPWVMPHTNRRVTPAERALFRRVPAVQRLVRAATYAAREVLVLGMRGNRLVLRVMEGVGTRHLRRQVPDRDLRRRLRPRYSVGCKRILISNNYYPALTQPNVELVTGGIREVRASSIVGQDGVERPVDAIVLGTGFHVTDIPAARLVRGAGGRTLAAVWRGSPQAYKGTTIAGFPNLFMLVGPNTGLGHNSIVYMIESQLDYVMGALDTMRARGLEVVDVRPEAQERWNAAIQRRMPGTVWVSGGCASWYLDAHGRNTTLWPGHTFTFRAATRAFDPEAYALTPGAARARAAAS